MSLYHEAASVLNLIAREGGSLKSRVFGKKDLKSPASQVYALAAETCKWSSVLSEVVENAALLQHERKITPALAILLAHDLLLAKNGVALPQTHGLRAAVERHKARLTSEFTRARLRRKAASVEALRANLEAEALSQDARPRWVRINAVRTSLDAELDSTFAGFEVVPSLQDVLVREVPQTSRLYIDGHVPNLVAVSPAMDMTRTEAYRAGRIILQDKASCFPAYLLDPDYDDGDVIDACAAPGNKTTHLAGILSSRVAEHSALDQTIFAFEKNKTRAETLEKMVSLAGSASFTNIGRGQDFLRVDPRDPAYKKVGALLLDPSCSGSGIVGRDDTPDLHLPAAVDAPKADAKAATAEDASRKRKRAEDEDAAQQRVMVDDDGQETNVSSERELQKRLEALSAFQLTLLLHAFEFPAARKITYSTCSVHAEENENVVVKALRSDIAKRRGWKVLERAQQVRGMRDWPVRGDKQASQEDESVAEACIRSYKDDGRGLMGFFVACFVRRDDTERKDDEDDDGPYVRDAEGRIIRDRLGMPTLKSTGQTLRMPSPEDEESSDDQSNSSEQGDVDFDGDGDDDGPYLRDEEGRINRDENGIPTLKPTIRRGKEVERDGMRSSGCTRVASAGEEEDDSEWGGLSD